MSEPGPIIFGMSVEQFADLARRATREAVRETLRAGIPVTGVVDGKIRVTYPTDARALELLKDDPTEIASPKPPT